MTVEVAIYVVILETTCLEYHDKDCTAIKENMICCTERLPSERKRWCNVGPAVKAKSVVFERRK